MISRLNGSESVAMATVATIRGVVVSTGALTLAEVFEKMRDGSLEEQTGHVRARYAEKEANSTDLTKGSLQVAKSHLLTVVAAGIWDGPIVQAVEEGRAQFNGIVALDLDKLDNAEAVREALREVPYVAGAGISGSGTGVRVFARYAGPCEDKVRFKEIFRFMEADMLERGFVVDTSCKDWSRKAYIAHDPDAWTQAAIPLKVPVGIREEVRSKPKVKAAKIEAASPAPSVSQELNARFKSICAAVVDRWKSGGYPSQSEADFALAMDICNLTEQPGERSALFMSSPLWRDHRKMDLALSKAGGKVEKENSVKVDFSPETVEAYLESLKPAPFNPAETDLPFPIHCFPTKARDMALEIARTSTSQSLGLAAACVLSTAGASLGAGLRLPVMGSKEESSTAKYCYGNLFMLTLARSSAGKGSSYGPAVAPVVAYTSKKLTDDEERQARLRGDLKLALRNLESAVKQASGSGAETDRRLVGDAEVTVNAVRKAQNASQGVLAEDITGEALAERANTRPGGSVAIFSTDGRNVLASIGGRYSTNPTGDEALYCKGYSNESINVDRKREGGSFTVARFNMSMHLMVQPDVMETVFTKASMTQSGLLARCLISMPFAEPIVTCGYAVEADEGIAKAYDKRITSLLTHYHANGDIPQTVRNSQACEDAFHALHTECVKRVQIGGSERDIDAFVGRWAENAHKIALVLHALHWGAKAHLKPLSEATVAHAVEIQRWFNAQQILVLQPYRQEKGSKEKSRLVEILTEAGGEVTVRDLMKRHTLGGGTLERLLELFPETFEVVTRKKEGGGRPSKVVKMR